MLLITPQHVQIHRQKVVADVRLNKKRNPSVTVRLNDKVIWHDIPREWHPWKLAAIDVDGDGAEEFVVALAKFTRHSPHRLHTLFIYGFDGTHIYPKWRGSSMGRDFIDFAVVNSAQSQRLITLDHLLNGRFAVTCHVWKGFGFEKIWEHGDWKKARLEVRGNQIKVFTDDGPKLYAANGVSSTKQ